MKQEIMRFLLGFLIFASLIYNGIILYWQFIGGKIIWASEYLPMNEWGQQNIWFSVIFEITLSLCLMYVIAIKPLVKEVKNKNG